METRSFAGTVGKPSLKPVSPFLFLEVLFREGGLLLQVCFLRIAVLFVKNFNTGKKED